MENPVIECGIALGSNTGDRVAFLRAAVAALRAHDPNIEVSPAYETAPVDCPDGSGAFLNAAAVLQWTGTPESLLETLRGIEGSLGRPASRPRNAPRAIDLDILYAGDAVRTNPELILPHPRLHLRRFVLQPLADLRPDLIVAGFSLSVRQLLEALPPDDSQPERRHAEL